MQRNPVEQPPILSAVSAELAASFPIIVPEDHAAFAGLVVYYANVRDQSDAESPKLKGTSTASGYEARNAVGREIGQAFDLPGQSAQIIAEWEHDPNASDAPRLTALEHALHLREGGTTKALHRNVRLLEKAESVGVSAQTTLRYDPVYQAVRRAHHNGLLNTNDRRRVIVGFYTAAVQIVGERTLPNSQTRRDRSYLYGPQNRVPQRPRHV